MDIIIAPYKLQVDASSKERFNVIKTVKTKDGSKNPTSDVSLGYGISLERAIRIMINDKLEDKFKDDSVDAITLQKYLDIYIPSIDALMNRVDTAIKELKKK